MLLGLDAVVEYLEKKYRGMHFLHHFFAFCDTCKHMNMSQVNVQCHFWFSISYYLGA